MPVMCTSPTIPMRVLVDTGMTELHPAVADMDPRLRPLSKQDFDSPASASSSTHTCTSTTAAATTPRQQADLRPASELDDARSGTTTIREGSWARRERVPVDGELELRPGSGSSRRCHTRTVVVVETGGVRSSSAATWRFGSEPRRPHTEGQLRVRALDPELVWLAHEHEPGRPRTV
jgi:N-acyl homoserine lactone hydrolase